MDTDEEGPKERWIHEYTRIESPLLVPELRLHLATETSCLWRATDDDLRRWGIEDPFWAFAWPGGQAMARFVLDQRVWFEGRAVLDYGTGSGIAALAAAKSGARSVRALDHDPWSKVAVQLNARLNDVNIFPEIGEISYDKPILEDTVLLADMTYDAVTTANIVQWVRTLQTRKVTVWIADPGRGYISEDLFPRVATYSAPADIDVNGAYMVRTHIYRVC